MNKIPNILTSIRMLTSIPALLLFVWISNPNIQLLLLILVSIAAITDAFDGIIARKYGWISDFGKNFDPLADKWLATLYVPLVGLGMIHPIPVALMWIRDISSTHLRTLHNRPMPARLSGKIKTAISFPLLCLLIATIPTEGGYLPITWAKEPLYWIGSILLSIVCIWSGVDYVKAFAIVRE